MKKYKLTKELKQYVGHLHDAVKTIDEWIELGFNINALEEVSRRITLNYKNQSNDDCGLYRSDNVKMGGKERLLFEKALNGELLDIDSLDDGRFAKWYMKEDVCISPGFYYKKEGIKALLKEYLKQRNDKD